MKDLLEMKVKRDGPVLFSPYNQGDGIKKALEIGRENVLVEVRTSKIKGRGGAGFPTSTKWMLTAAAKDPDKYVICNADEGEPGTFKDRVLLLEFPHLVFEGMVIAGYTIAAKEGIMYLRGEYEYMFDYLNECLEDMRKKNILGKNILGSDFNYDISIRLGSGAYVCGEETALIRSLEGHRGEPKKRPPFPVLAGYFEHPTTVNNVETLSAIPHIITKGGEWYKNIGTEFSSGSKLFSISGDCKNPGVYELPWGTTVKELLDIAGAEDPKAVQVGGASGICIPASQFDRKLGYEDAPTGGAVIVFGHKRNMLQVLKNFQEFFVEESCGQCVPCRSGNIKLLEGVEKIEKGDFTYTYLNTLKELAETMSIASKCGLGQTSANAFLSIVENFKDEVLYNNKLNGGHNGR